MSNRDYTRRASEKLLRQYVLSLLVCLGAIILLAALCVVFLGNFSFWQNSVVLTFFVYFCKMYIVPLFLLSVGLSWLWCSVFFLKKSLSFLDDLVDAADILTNLEDDRPIVLAPELLELEEHLNLAKSRAVRTAYAAKEAEQRKNDLVVYLAHDLKTPLTSVVGYLTLLRDEPDLSSALRARYTGVALDKAERLEDLINEFFDIARFSLTHLELTLVSTDLTRMLQQMSSEFQPMLAEKNLTCALQLPEKLPYTGDPDKLARVFDNLLRNAWAYSPPGSSIRVSGRREEGEIVLTFANAGPTIPPEKLNRIFDQFFRLDDSRASSTGGAGLGLAIAKEIIVLHGGSIQAWSGGEQVIFTVSLPEQAKKTIVRKS